MDDRELERLLAEAGRERYVPSAHLMRATRAALRGRRLLPVACFASLGLHILGGLVLLFLLATPLLETPVKVFLGLSLAVLGAAVLLVVVALRRQVVWFFGRMEQLIGNGI